MRYQPKKYHLLVFDWLFFSSILVHFPPNYNWVPAHLVGWLVGWLMSLDSHTNCFCLFLFFLQKVSSNSCLTNPLFYTVMMVQVVLATINRLRVVPLSLSPSCARRKKTAGKKSGGERRAKVGPPRFRTAIFLPAVFFRVTHDGPSERGTIRSLTIKGKGYKSQFSGRGQPEVSLCTTVASKQRRWFNHLSTSSPGE